MKSMPVRLVFLILFLGAAAGAGYVVWISETKLHAIAASSSSVDAHASSAARGVLELRAAQQAYVAAGQGERFWIDKVAATLPELKASIEAIQAQAATPRARTAAETALAVLQDFERMDIRAGDHARNDQRLLASDLIFSDGLEMTRTVVAALDEARAAEREAHDVLVRDARRTEIAALGGFAGVGLLVVLLLLPVPRPPIVRASDPRSPAQAAAVPDPFDLALTLDDDADGWSRAKPAKAPMELEPQRAAGQPKSVPGGQPAERESPPAEPMLIGGLAAVCTELARVADTRSLPSILERTATALDASGIVLWIADPDGRELAPIAAHGYPPQLVIRLGAIARDAQNATAAAFRTGLVQTVNADAVSEGAIAAPLVTPNGVVGVMAAEVRNGGEKQPARLAAAAIVAAQLATLMGPPVPRAHPKADVAGA